jgi:ABC-type phosphate/phosphonate transport system substrate-binding protein
MAFAASAFAADSDMKKVSFEVDAAAQAKTVSQSIGALPGGVMVLSAPPREDERSAKEMYGPIADYLSQATGKKVVFQYSRDWLSYQTEMKKGAYDIVFDGPHLNGWRAAKLQHNTLAKAPGEHVFVVAALKHDDKLSEVRQLAGRRVCSMNPPNLGALTLLSEFSNPSRQPVITHIDGWEDIYKGLIDGRCQAAVLPLKNLQKYDRGALTKILHRGPVFPNQAFSAGPRVTREDQAKLARALTATESSAITAKLREAYAIEGGFVPAKKEEYVGMAGILKDSWGYNN